MQMCPKCCSTDVRGPRFIITTKGEERLLYVCMQCGFQQSGPTMEQRRLGDEIERALSPRRV
jgi:RNase P subunit RPR2